MVLNVTDCLRRLLGNVSHCQAWLSRCEPCGSTSSPYYLCSFRRDLRIDPHKNSTLLVVYNLALTRLAEFSNRAGLSLPEMKDSMWTALYFCIFIVTAALLYNQGKKRSPYCYSPLSSGHDSIRLLRLMPHEDETADIQCELFEYSLQNTSKGTHLYDALSYVWGNPDEKLPIFLHEHSFNVTINLRAALSRLRNHSVERILWVDALCIN